MNVCHPLPVALELNVTGFCPL